MNLKLSAVTHNDQRLTSPITAFFDDAGGTVGRADHCTLALPDPERFISRKQAEVVAVTGGLFLIRNVGSANPIVIGQRSLGLNESAVLQDGDLVRIAGYELQVSYTTQGPAPRPTVLQRNQPAVSPVVQQAAPPVAAPVVVEAPAATAVTANPFADLLAPGAQAASPPSASAAANPFGDLLAPGPQPAQAPVAARADAWVPSPPAAPQAVQPAVPQAPAANPFADLLAPGPQMAPASVGLGAVPGPGGGNPFSGLLDSAPQRVNGSAPLDVFQAPPAPREPDLMPAAAGIPAMAWQAPAPGAGTLPDDFDPFDLPPVKGLAPAAPMADPFGLVQNSKPQSIDRQFGLPTATEGRDPLADFMRPTTVDLLPGDKRVEPVIDILGTLAPPPMATQMTVSDADRLAPIHDAFELPRPVSPAPAPRGAPAPAAASSADIAGLWMAFCKGAGIQVAAPVDEAQLAQRLERVGRIVKAAVSGTQELMAVRASTKYEMRAQVTQIQARSNNPLKFAPDVRTGVEQLVEPAARGFLEGPAAMEDAMKDLIGHMIGSVAGMRAALEGSLDNFTPEMLEKTLGQGSMLDSLVPMGRKARLWELYLLRYQTLRESAQDDFHTVFGKAFLAAYEQQVERLKKKEAQS
ncbi:type VI secretion system-associated FHA domain protein TagH [Roseateles sp. NT4]|uniref:type VI secretion system-associated FHA domain protein TagH n=1 Tax=Roseateles sp. NT4 TaxID=3453715 RepID=UPI003EE95676